MNPHAVSRLAKPYPGNRRRSRRLDPALRVAEEISALLVILSTIAVFGALAATLLQPVVRQ